MHISIFIERLSVVGTDVGVGISGITSPLSRMKMNIREKAKKTWQVLKTGDPKRLQFTFLFSI